MKNSVVFVFLFFAFFGFAQPSIQDVLPKTPDVENFERYGNIPVSEYTGSPNVTIPLYTINYGDLTIPLQLTYSSNGIKVNEEASEFGLGWYFNTGMVTQIVNGKDDLVSGMKVEIPDFFYKDIPTYILAPRYPQLGAISRFGPLSISEKDPVRYSYGTNLQEGFSDDKYFIAQARIEPFNLKTLYFPYKGETFYNFYDHVNYPYYSLSEYQKRDVEMDFFNASFFGHQLSFYYKGGCHVLNKKNYNVKIYRGDSIRIEIKAPDGIIYIFKEELVTKSTADGNSPSLYGSYSSNKFNNYGSIELASENDLNKVLNASSRIWKITEIIDVKGNSIKFNYEKLNFIRSRYKDQGKVDFVNITSQVPESNINHVVPYSTTMNHQYFGLFGPAFNSGSQNLPQHYNHGKSIHAILGQYKKYLQGKSILTSIDFGSNRIRFVNSLRDDIPYDKKVDKIVVEENHGLSSITIKEINFEQDYFNGNSLNSLDKRLKLDRVVINDKNYQFYYNQKETLPAKNSNSFDYWGYYNGYASQTIFSNPFRLLDDKSKIISWAHELEQQIIGVDNRSARLDFCRAGILEKVIYPTGGFTQFEYELNRFDNYIFPDFDNRVYDEDREYINYSQTESQGYGLRLKETIDSPDGIILNKKKYSYEGGKQINALNEDLHNIRHKSEHGVVTESGYPYNLMVSVRAGYKISSYSDLIYQTNIMSNGSYVGYDQVVVEEIGINNESKGKIKKYFSNHPDVTPFEKYGKVYLPGVKGFTKMFGHSFRGVDLDNGSLLKKEIFNSENEILLIEEYQYEVLKHRGSSLYPYTVKAVQRPGTYWFQFDTAPNNKIQYGINEYLFFFYPLDGLETKLSSKKVTEFFPSGKIELNTDYTYDDNNQLTEEKTITGDNKTLLKKYKYWYSKSTPFSNTFRLQNRYSEVIETEEVTESNRKVTSIDYSSNEATANLVLPISVKTSIRNQPEETDITYDRYDSKGNVQQYTTKDGVSTILIWGYNQTLPIAKIENADYDEVDTKCRIYELELAIANEYHISIIDKLRLHLPESRITTYTHKPLIGVETITDPRGRTITYSYDENNRLEAIRDHEGNLINEYEYNYKN